jgi:hypothetical protein
VLGEDFIPQGGPCLITINHYTRRGLPAWWLVLAASACVPAEIHWIMTSAWTFPDALRHRLVTPVTRLLFRRMAHVYGFTSMPPMPPASQDIEERARAVRQVLAYARRAEYPVIGLAPEGRDAPHEQPGVLIEPPPGAGRFVLQLARLGLPISPVGVYEEAGNLYIRFGELYELEIPQGKNAEQRDWLASQAVMLRIAALLPPELHGNY